MGTENSHSIVGGLGPATWTPAEGLAYEATNPTIPADRLTTLLEVDESAVVSWAAANRTLLVVTMHQVLDQAGL